ncbi:MAG: hypothetical protein ACI4I6_05595 [Hominimerdicola sp.]
MNEFENLDMDCNEKCMVSSIWKSLALFLLGVVIGFLIAPMKKGISFCNNNGNENTFSRNNAKFSSSDENDEE